MVSSSIGHTSSIAFTQRVSEEKRDAAASSRNVREKVCVFVEGEGEVMCPLCQNPP